MDGIGDLVIILSIFASGAVLWLRWSSARAGKRALALIRRDADKREPGLTLNVLGAVMSRDRRLVDVEIRMTNPADTWNLVANAVLEVEYSRDGELCPPVKVPVDRAHAPSAADTLRVPFVIPANESATGRLFFRVREKLLRDVSIERWLLIAIDVDARRMEALLRMEIAGDGI